MSLSAAATIIAVLLALVLLVWGVHRRYAAAGMRLRPAAKAMRSRGKHELEELERLQDCEDPSSYGNILPDLAGSAVTSELTPPVAKEDTTIAAARAVLAAAIGDARDAHNGVTVDDRNPSHDLPDVDQGEQAANLQAAEDEVEVVFDGEVEGDELGDGGSAVEGDDAPASKPARKAFGDGDSPELPPLGLMKQTSAFEDGDVISSLTLPPAVPSHSQPTSTQGMGDTAGSNGQAEDEGDFDMGPGAPYLASTKSLAQSLD